MSLKNCGASGRTCRRYIVGPAADGKRRVPGPLEPDELLVAHFLKYQPHHCRQVYDMPTQTDAARPVLDMHQVIQPNPD